MQGRVQLVGHEDVLAFLAQVVRAQAHGKQGCLELVDEGGKRVARGKLARPGLLGAAVRLAPFAARRMQVLGESGNVETGHLRAPSVLNPGRSEERRVGKECRSRW